MKRNFSRQIKLARELGDWTKISLDEHAIDDINVQTIAEPSFDSLSSKALTYLHYLHYRMSEDICQRYAALLSLKANLRIVRVSQIASDDLLSAFQDQPFFYGISVRGLGPMALSLDTISAHQIANRMIGGSGEIEDYQRPLSDLENALLYEQTQQVLPTILEHWKGMIPQSEISTKFSRDLAEHKELRSFDGSCVIFESVYDFNNDVKKSFSMIYPAALIKKLYSHRCAIEDRVKRRVQLSAKTLKSIKIPFRVRLGDTTVPMSDLTQLQAGDIVKLDQKIYDPIRAVLGDHVKLPGQVMQSEQLLAFQVLGQPQAETLQRAITGPLLDPKAKEWEDDGSELSAETEDVAEDISDDIDVDADLAQESDDFSDLEALSVDPSPDVLEGADDASGDEIESGTESASDESNALDNEVDAELEREDESLDEPAVDDDDLDFSEDAESELEEDLGEDVAAEVPADAGESESDDDDDDFSWEGLDDEFE